MKYRLLDMVVCPHCQGRLICAAFSMVAREVLEGVLTCGCGRWYPIIGGVPRLLPDSLMADFLLDNIDFLEKHKGNIPKSLAPSDGEDEYINLKRRTSSSFGFEWGTFSEVIEEYEAIFLGHISPVEESFFRHKLVLDAGCGAGRYSYYAAKSGAEVIAVDFSKAVEAAYKNNRHFSKVHVDKVIYTGCLSGRNSIIYSVLGCCITCLTLKRGLRNWWNCSNQIRPYPSGHTAENITSWRYTSTSQQK